MASRRRISYASSDEILATIARSSFPTVITEGMDDVIVFRRLEDDFARARLTIIPAGGREVVLELFERWNPATARAPVVFVADRDLWVLSMIPSRYDSQKLIFTNGYSIENDIFQDGEVTDLFGASQLTAFIAEKDSYCEWFALAVQRHRVQPGTTISHHPDFVLKPENYSKLVALTAGESFPTDLANILKTEFARLLRGKSLLSLVNRHLKDFPSRVILRLGSARKGPNYQRIALQIEVGTGLLR